MAQKSRTATLTILWRVPLARALALGEIIGGEKVDADNHRGAGGVVSEREWLMGCGRVSVTETPWKMLEKMAPWRIVEM